MNQLTKYGVFFLITAIALLYTTSSYAQEKISVEILPGFAVVLPSDLMVHQDGFQDIEFKARWDEESFDLPIYYSIRLAYSLNEEFRIEAELNHLKLYLSNSPDEIQWFSISHGYNQLWFNLVKKQPYLSLKAGIGPVIAHPENTVRNQKLDENNGIGGRGYYIAGITGQIAVQKRIPLGNYLFISTETKMNISYSQVKVSGGFANVSVYALHGLAGIGVRF